MQKHLSRILPRFCFLNDRNLHLAPNMINRQIKKNPNCILGFWQRKLEKPLLKPRQTDEIWTRPLSVSFLLVSQESQSQAGLANLD